MKKILLFAFLSVAALTGFSQTFGNGAPGFLGGPELDDAAGNPTVNPNTLNVATPLKLHIGFQNASFAWPIPNNNIQIQIDLGSKLVINPAGAYVLANAPLNQYFTWSLTNNGTDQVIVGTQKTGAGADIPPGFAGTFEFEVQASALGTSSIVGNILITNNNPTDKITDPVDADNSTSSAYTVTTALPVKFLNIDAQKSNCNINVNWAVGEQYNVGSYEVQASKDGANFVSVASVPASNATSYSASFALTDDIKANVIYVRVKEIDVDGRYGYSESRAVQGNCDNGSRLAVFGYPNPVAGNSITIKAKDGLFNGKYKLELMDNNGKLYQIKEVNAINTTTVPFDFNTALSPGNYVIRISTLDGSAVGNVQFIKVGVL